MDWPAFNRAVFHRLLQRLEEDRRMCLEMKTWLLKYGYLPGHPLYVENERTVQAIVDYIAAVRATVHEFAPYRCLVDPYKNSGLSAHLKPDFAARGKANID